MAFKTPYITRELRNLRLNFSTRLKWILKKCILERLF